MPKYIFKLFVTGHTSRAAHAVQNLRTLCERSLRDNFELEIIDVLEQPQMAEDYRIMATPTLLKQAPAPSRRIVGDLQGLDLVTLGLPSSIVSNHTGSNRDV